MKKKIYFMVTAILVCFSLLGCEPIVYDNNYAYYNKTTAIFANVEWEASVDIPKRLPAFSIGDDLSPEYVEKIKDFYGFDADCVYKRGAYYEKNDGISLRIDETGTVRLKLCNKPMSENNFPDDELISRSEAYLKSVGLWNSKLKNSSCWTCFGKTTYTGAIVFSHHTNEGYSLEDDAVTVYLSGNEVYMIDFRISEHKGLDFEDCISWKDVKRNFKTSVLYTNGNPGHINKVKVEYAKLIYTGSNKSNSLYPIVYIKGVLYDSKDMYLFFTSIQLF